LFFNAYIMFRFVRCFYFSIAVLKIYLFQPIPVLV
jgi:hypothetical protein